MSQPHTLAADAPGAKVQQRKASSDGSDIGRQGGATLLWT